MLDLHHAQSSRRFFDRKYFYWRMRFFIHQGPSLCVPPFCGSIIVAILHRGNAKWWHMQACGTRNRCLQAVSCGFLWQVVLKSYCPETKYSDCLCVSVSDTGTDSQCQTQTVSDSVSECLSVDSDSVCQWTVGQCQCQTVSVTLTVGVTGHDTCHVMTHP